MAEFFLIAASDQSIRVFKHLIGVICLIGNKEKSTAADIINFQRYGDARVIGEYRLSFRSFQIHVDAGTDHRFCRTMAKAFSVVYLVYTILGISRVTGK